MVVGKTEITRTDLGGKLAADHIGVSQVGTRFCIYRQVRRRDNICCPCRILIHSAIDRL